MKSRWLILILVVLLFYGCSFMTMFKPELALDKYQMVGVINFTSDSEGNLDEVVSEEFLKEIRKASKKAIIIELGNESKALESVNEKELSASAINAIAVKNDLDALIIGQTEINDISPQIDAVRESAGRTEIAGKPMKFGADNTPRFGYASIRAKFDVDASLNVSLIETKTVKTVWTGSAREKKTVTPANIYPVKDTKGVFFDVKDSKEAHGGLASALAQDIISKLRVR
ncbi:MAG: hypothetical protein AAB116_23015 [Candidatus Poribacteria bacterium]